MRLPALTARIGTICALLVLVAPVAPARAADAATARSRATAAAAKVDALLDTYARAQKVEADGVRALAQAVAAQTAAEVSAEDSARQAGAARGLAAEQVRALYADGGTAGLLNTVLAADSPDDLLRRISTADRIAAAVLADGRSQVEQAESASRLAGARQRQTEDASARQATALQALQDRSAEAATALDGAKRTLARLDRRAKRAAAAERAARAIAAAEQAAGAARSAAAGPMTALAIPADYQTAYQAAAKTCPGMDWTLLAGVGQVESGHGRNVGPSSAGAIGPMQFMPATFASVGVDGDGDSRKDAWDPQDAIFSAAKYLCISGADGTASGIHRALLAYNHAEWYVDLVLSAQAAIRAKIAESY